MRPLVAHCHLGLSKLYRRTGQREQAQEHLTTATAMYREMGMTYWLERAEEVLTEEGRGEGPERERQDKMAVEFKVTGQAPPGPRARLGRIRGEARVNIGPTKG